VEIKFPASIFLPKMRDSLNEMKAIPQKAFLRSPKKWRTKPSVYALTGYAATSKYSLHAFVPTKALHSKPKFFSLATA